MERERQVLPVASSRKEALAPQLGSAGMPMAQGGSRGLAQEQVPAQSFWWQPKAMAWTASRLVPLQSVEVLARVDSQARKEGNLNRPRGR